MKRELICGRDARPAGVLACPPYSSSD